jgi:hypothetical protein
MLPAQWLKRAGSAFRAVVDGVREAFDIGAQSTCVILAVATMHAQGHAR